MALTVILIGVILYFSFNRAIITIISKKEKVETDFVMQLAGSPKAGESGVMPGQVFETTVEGAKKFSASGIKSLITDAQGKITVINNSAKDQPLVEKTRFLSAEGILFRLKKSIVVPAGGKVEAEVYADNPNLGAAVGPTKFTIPGLAIALQEKIYGESTKPLIGVTKETVVVSAEDIAGAKKALTEDLVNQAEEEFRSKLASDDASWKIVTKVTELTSNVDAKANEAKDEFTVSLKLKVGGIAFDNEKLLVLAKERLANSLPEGKELSEVNENSFVYPVKSYDLAAGKAIVEAHLEGISTVRETDLIFDRNKLIGLNKGQVEAYFKNFDPILSVKVNLTPFWVWRVPKLKDHIIINIEK
jgi:hypothetical protein